LYDLSLVRKYSGLASKYRHEISEEVEALRLDMEVERGFAVVVLCKAVWRSAAERFFDTTALTISRGVPIPHDGACDGAA
jgi:hypothetical protein